MSGVLGAACFTLDSASSYPQGLSCRSQVIYHVRLKDYVL